MSAIAKGLFVCACTVGMLVASASAAILTGNVDIPADVDLTTQGTIDWIHWGRAAAPDVNRKASGGSQISTYTMIGANSSRARLSDSASTYSWTDGAPTASASMSRTGVYINKYDGPGRGFQFTAPADLMERILDVYVGEWNATGTLEATLSDGSAPAFTHTLNGAFNQTVQGHYRLNYSANSPGQTLTIKWTETGDLGDADNVTLQAAALSFAVVPEPAAISLLGAAALMLMRRRKPL